MYYKTDTEQRMAEMESTICKSRCENEQKAVQVGDSVEAMGIIIYMILLNLFPLLPACTAFPGSPSRRPISTS